MKIIELSGSQYLNTDDEKQAWRLVDGNVLVFVMPIGRSGPGRRMHLARLGRGSVIPSLSRQVALGGELCLWQLLILPEGRARLESIDCDNSHRTAFLRSVGLNRRGLEIDEKLYGQVLIKEYAARQEISTGQISRRLENRRSFTEKSINSLRASFAGDTERINADAAGTGETLYDAASFLCSLRKLPVAPLGTIHSACGREYDMRDIARLSGFVCREIRLEGRWHGRDMEPVLCFRAENMSPVVCYLKGRRVRCFDPAEKKFYQLTEELAQGLDETAYVLCRPLPGSAVTIKEISRYALRELSAHDIAVMLVGSFLAAFVSLQFARLSETLYDVIIPQGSNQLLWGYGALMVSYMLGGVCFNIAKGIGSFRLNSRIKYSLQTAIYDRLFQLPESFFRSHENADLAYRAGMLADTYTGFFNNVSQILMMTLFSGIYLAKMYRYSALLSNIGLAFIALNIAVALIMGWLLNRLQRKRSRLVGALRSFLFQSFSGINTIRSSGAEDAALHKYMEKYVEMCSIELKSSRRQQLSTALSSFVSALATVILYRTVAGLASGLSVGGFMGFTSAYSALSSSMLQVASCLLSVFVMLPMLLNSMEIMKYPPERADRGYVPREVKGDIRVAGLSFAYGKSDKLQLQDINLHIKPGEYVALVGASGCGKSTLLRLLLGFEKPLRGKIYYDGVELERINKPELRRKMGVVLQDGVLFSGSIYRNIRIARPTATYEQVMEAVRAVDLEEDIAAMPLGLNTIVSEQAQTISGGQKQRILLARAVIGQPSVLMLDEATSALDNITQAKVCDNLAKLGSTRIVVAHRLSTVKDCDRIIVLDGGCIAEEGNFAQLMEKKGLFWQLARMQSL